jgi:hypothetical protein
LSAGSKTIITKAAMATHHNSSLVALRRMT